MRPDPVTVRRLLDDAGVESDLAEERFGVVCRLEAARVAGALEALREGGYESLVDLFAVDTGVALEVTYHMRSLVTDTDLFVRTGAPYDGTVPSVCKSHPAALYAEREAAELFGLAFEGHPNLTRLLTSEHVDGFLLRKDAAVRTREEVTCVG